LDPGKFIGQIYEAGVDVKVWPEALTRITRALRASAMSLTVTQLQTKVPPVVVAPCTDPEWLRVYSERWAEANIVRDRGLSLPLGQLYGFDDLGMTRAEFERTPMYNEFFAPQNQDHGLGMIVAKEATLVCAIGFYRSSGVGRFEREERLLLNILKPHLQRAIRLNLRLARIEMERDSAAEMLNRWEHGAILVDAQARILFANPAAEAVLKKRAGLRANAGRLEACEARETATLSVLIAGGADGIPGGMVELPCRDGGRAIVEVIALPGETSWRLQPPAAIVFLREAPGDGFPSREQIRRQFDFTPAQSALARELLYGDGIPAAVERLGISRSTARTHLLKMFQRTGTNRQAELVRLILQQTPAANPAQGEPIAKSSKGWHQPGWRGVVKSCLLPAVSTIGAATLGVISAL
jgi:DNA-binding CsgD family transcriptional regulator